MEKESGRKTVRIEWKGIHQKYAFNILQIKRFQYRIIVGMSERGREWVRFGSFRIQLANVNSLLYRGRRAKKMAAHSMIKKAQTDTRGL